MKSTLEMLVDAVDTGSPINWRQVAMRQQLEIVAAGRKFAEEAIERERAADDLYIDAIDPSGRLKSAIK